jgi:hypothetical protein
MSLGELSIFPAVEAGQQPGIITFEGKPGVGVIFIRLSLNPAATFKLETGI